MTPAELRALANKHLGHKFISDRAKDWMAVNTRTVLALLDVVDVAKRLTEANDLVLAMLAAPMAQRFSAMGAFDDATEKQQEAMRVLRAVLARLEGK